MLNINITAINQVLTDWNRIIDSHISSISVLSSSDKMKQIIDEYNVQKADKEDIGFNLFTIISDTFYRENFHRDIIYEFLNPQGSHKEGNKYLMLFLDMLNISRSLFQDAIVEKEYTIENNRRIDTLITDKTTKKAIIIENKMNNACDMDRQLPDYYNYIRKLAYDIISIVYIPLSNNKVPDTTNWKEFEKTSIKKCFKIVPAFSNNKERNLCDNWLKKCINSSDNIDCISGLRQYVKLIKFLNMNNMDNVIFEKFYENLKIGENLNTAISIRNMLNELPEYLASRIHNRYMTNYSPFTKFCHYKESIIIFDGFALNREKNSYKLDVECYESGYDLYFRSNRDCPNSEKNIKAIFPNFESLRDFQSEDGNNISDLFLHLGFNEEEKVIHIIDTLLKELSKMKQGI